MPKNPAGGCSEATLAEGYSKTAAAGASAQDVRQGRRSREHVCALQVLSYLPIKPMHSYSTATWDAPIKCSSTVWRCQLGRCHHNPAAAAPWLLQMATHWSWQDRTITAARLIKCHVTRSLIHMQSHSCVCAATHPSLRIFNARPSKAAAVRL